MSKFELLQKFTESQKCDFLGGVYDGVHGDLGNVKLMMQDESYDDGSAAVTRVYHFEKYDCYVQFEGYYASYNGYYDPICFLVEPKQVMTTVYEKVEPKTQDELTAALTNNSNLLIGFFDEDQWDDRIKEKFGECGVIDEPEAHEGESTFVVVHFKEPNLFVKFDGYYTSYSGFVYSDTFKIVEPKQKTVTYYE